MRGSVPWIPRARSLEPGHSVLPPALCASVLLHLGSLWLPERRAALEPPAPARHVWHWLDVVREPEARAPASSEPAASRTRGQDTAPEPPSRRSSGALPPSRSTAPSPRPPAAVPREERSSQVSRAPVIPDAPLPGEPATAAVELSSRSGARRVAAEARPTPLADELANAAQASTGPESRAPRDARSVSAASVTHRGPSSSARSIAPGGDVDLGAQRARYVESISARIRRHRHYPYLARRSGLQGTVCVRLSIHPNGTLARVDVTCGHSLAPLASAAREAVAAAAPFGPVPAGSGAPFSVDVPIVFQLDDAGDR